MKIELDINSIVYEVDVEPYESLNHVLRDKIGLTGTKRGCDTGGCGSCTVLLDGQAVYSCMVPAQRAEDRKVTTIEGLRISGQLDPLQDAFVEKGAIQCGYCTSGMVMSAKALLNQNIDPSENEIRDAIAGNICRCTGYVKIVDAITAAAETIKEGKESA